MNQFYMILMRGQGDAISPRMLFGYGAEPKSSRGVRVKRRRLKTKTTVAATTMLPRQRK
jgi:hypothetical protein